MKARYVRTVPGPLGVAAGALALTTTDPAAGWWALWAVCAVLTLTATAYTFVITR
ncbi:hypothetical protein [Streptomyces sp. NPDC049906]|uniref:hypothetical protein n=1 Tax=Streptomyces sp. NPDC049906 TaxID=3155656 RepID=UPI00343785F7